MRLLLLAFLILCRPAFGQDFLEIMDNDSNETQEERVALMLDFLGTVDFRTAADIGSGNMELILRIADHFPDRTFALEDIDTTECNRANMLLTIKELDLQRVDPGRLSVHLGDSLSTHLPERTFDLVILAAVFHAIDRKASFFAEIRKILAPGGRILIEDVYYATPPSTHKGCANRYLTNDEMEQWIKDLGLTVIKDWRRVGIRTRSNGAYSSRIILCTLP